MITIQNTQQVKEVQVINKQKIKTQICRTILRGN